MWRSFLSFPTLRLRVAALSGHTANQEGANQVFLPCKWRIWLLAGNHAGEYTPKKPRCPSNGGIHCTIEDVNWGSPYQKLYIQPFQVSV